MRLHFFLPLLALTLACALLCVGCDNFNFGDVTDGATNGTMANLSVEETLERYGDQSHIMILCQPPVDILAISPDDEKTGRDPASGLDLDQIARSEYFTEQIQGDYDWDYIEQSVLEIARPESGRYEIVLSSRLPGTSYLSVRACNAAGIPTDTVYLTEFAPGGDPQRFVLQYDKSSGGISQMISYDTGAQ